MADGEEGGPDRRSCLWGGGGGVGDWHAKCGGGTLSSSIKLNDYTFEMNKLRERTVTEVGLGHPKGRREHIRTKSLKSRNALGLFQDLCTIVFKYS